MVQWVKDLTAMAPVTAEAQVHSPAWSSGLRSQCCHSCGVGHSCSLDSWIQPLTQGVDKKKKKRAFSKCCFHINAIDLNSFIAVLATNFTKFP